MCLVAQNRVWPSVPDVSVTAVNSTYMHACGVAQSFLTLCDSMDCSLPGSSVHKIL